ncbi:hypothetical protein KC343_g28 [Hortaea werneckii]|nr:hypothetical protein KC317_g29 [Hortaea werneckii]KAI7628665.1 hypothetical protein KC346_g31 [Hortaea werneckii]KAI7638504.1 hypothetical protein KC343_g28 [Hortaea werneckii]
MNQRRVHASAVTSISTKAPFFASPHTCDQIRSLSPRPTLPNRLITPEDQLCHIERIDPPANDFIRFGAGGFEARADVLHCLVLYSQFDQHCLAFRILGFIRHRDRIISHVLR